MICMGYGIVKFKDWHCTIRGPSDTEFEGGLYHARIVLPPGLQPFSRSNVRISPHCILYWQNTRLRRPP